MQDLIRHIAATLQLLRKQRGWSLDKTAAATGVSKAMLGQIERGESSPTVATLLKIATGFETSFSTFLEPSVQLQDIWRTSDSSAVQHRNEHDIAAKAVIPFDPQFGFELLLVTLPAGVEHLSAAHAHGVTEHVIPLDGTLEIMSDGQWHTLAAGDAMRFDASRPHGYRNSSGYTVRFHNLICYSAD